MDRERRVRILRVEEHLIVDVLNFSTSGPGFALGISCFDPLPRDVVIERVAHNFLFRAFDLIVSHPTFDVVPDGMEPPVHNRELARSAFYPRPELQKAKFVPGDIVFETPVEIRGDGTMVTLENSTPVGKDPVA